MTITELKELFTKEYLSGLFDKFYDKYNTNGEIMITLRIKEYYKNPDNEFIVIYNKSLPEPDNVYINYPKYEQQEVTVDYIYIRALRNDTVEAASKNNSNIRTTEKLKNELNKLLIELDKMITGLYSPINR
jgi:ABC-type antimicrobial peptide transport system permease subunit